MSEAHNSGRTLASPPNTSYGQVGNWKRRRLDESKENMSFTD